MRSEVLDQHVRVDAQLLDRLGLQRLDAQPLLRACHLVAMDRVGEVAQIVAQCADLTSDEGQRDITLGAPLFGACSFGRRLFERTSHPMHRVCRAAADRARHGGLALAPHPACCSPLAGGKLGACGLLQRLGPTQHGASAFLASAQREAQFGLGGARRGGAALEAVAVVARWLFFARLGAGVVQALTQREVVGAVTAQCGLGRGDGPFDALGLATPGADRASELPQPLGDRSHPGVGLVQPLECGLHLVVGCCHPIAGGRQRELGLLAAADRVLDLVLRLVDGRLDLDQAGHRGAAATDVARGEHVAVGRDRRDALTTTDQIHGDGRIRGKGNAIQQLLDRRSHAVGTGDHVSGPDGAAAELRPAGDLDLGCRGGHEQTCPTGVLLPQRRQGALRRLDGVDGHCIRCPPQCGSNAGLMSRRDLQQGGDRTHQTVHLIPCCEERGRAILAAQVELEGLQPGAGTGAVAVGVPLCLAPLRHLCLGQIQCSSGLLVVCVQAFFALFVHRDRRFQSRELLLGPAGAGPALFDGLLEPADLSLSGLDPAAPCAHLPGQRGQTLATICSGTDETGQASGLRGIRDLYLGAAGDRGLERLLGLRGLGDQRLLLLAHRGGLSTQLFGVARPVVRVVALVLREQADAFGSQRPGRHETLAQRGQGEPAFLRTSQQRRRLLRLELKRGQARANDGQCLFDLGATGDQSSLVGDLLLEGAGQLDEIVGKQSKPCVAGFGLDRGGLARSLGLAAERSELAADLTGEVVDPGEVDLHGLHLAQRALLALAVLQDTGGLLDEATPLLGRGAQDRIELPLTDDDVHLAADAGVGQQLLDVQQAAGRAVDGVLGAAVAEHRPRDADLGVVDRQRAVGVVDGQRDLGPAQWSTCRRAGEDDVLHLAAAQTLGTLLAHDPGEGVHDVGLAGAVRADDAGDARLKAQRGCRRKRLEPTQGQALDVHERWAPLGRR